jgi:hypothetical protein
MNTTTARTIAHLDKLRNWLDSHDLPDNSSVHAHARPTGPAVSIFPYDAETMREARRVVGPMVKDANDQGFTLKAKIDGIEFTIFPPAGTCKKVKVGTRLEETVKEVRPAETVTVEEEVDVYEWDCGGVLVTDDAEAVPA